MTNTNVKFNKTETIRLKKENIHGNIKKLKITKKTDHFFMKFIAECAFK